MNKKGKLKDTSEKIFFADNANFAELFNKTLFVKHPISPDSLSDADTNISAIFRDENEITGIQRQQDVSKNLNDGRNLLLLVQENQSLIDYQMPARIFDCAAASIRSQISRLNMERKASAEKLSGDEYTSGFKKTDRIKPMIVLVVYYGEKPWDGPRKLSDMYEKYDEVFSDYLIDFKMNFLDVRRMSDEQLNTFSGEVKGVLGFTKKSADKEELLKFVSENNEVFSDLSQEAADMITAVTNMDDVRKLFDNSRTDEGGYNMCKALEDLKRDCKAEGEAVGIEKGRAEGRAEGEAVGIGKGIEKGIEALASQLRKMGISEEMLNKAVANL
jgi:hypothetical protein